MKDLDRPHTSEDFKAIWHGLVIAVVAPSFAYNCWRLSAHEREEPKTHLVVNVGLFGAVLVLEIFGNLPRHLKQSSLEPR